MQQPERRRDWSTATGGFTWIEVAGSIAVLTIVIVATTSLIANGMMAMRMNSLENIARASTIRELERLKSLPWSTIAAIPLYPPTAKNFCTDQNGVAIGGCQTGLEQIPGAVGRVYVSNFVVNGAAQPNVKQVTVAVSVYGTSNVLANLFQPFFDSVAYAGGGSSGGGGPPSGGGGNVGSLRSVWRLTTLISANGLSQ